MMNIRPKGNTAFYLLVHLIVVAHRRSFLADGFATIGHNIGYGSNEATVLKKKYTLQQLALSSVSVVGGRREINQKDIPQPSPLSSSLTPSTSRSTAAETVARSAVKTFIWRLLSVIVTMKTTLIFTGQWHDAVKMVVISFLPKFITLFLLDRFVNRNVFQRHGISSKLQRSLIKLLAWRTFSIVINLALTTLAINKLDLASKIVSTDFAVKTLLFFLYERIWGQIDWGIEDNQIDHPNSNSNKDTATTLASTSGATALTNLTAVPSEQTGVVTLSRAGNRTSNTMGSSTETQTEAAESPFSWENQWFPVLPLSYLSGLEPNKPISARIMGRDLVVWKSSSGSENKWSVFEDICPHRRAPLSTGQVVKGCLTCRYHGWEFDPNGQVSKLPMQPSVSSSTTSLSHNRGTTNPVRANAFPSQSCGGLLWVFLGTRIGIDDGSIPSIPADAVPTEEEIAGVDWMFNRNPISYISMMENTFDPAHSPWTHEQMVGFGGMQFSPTDILPMKNYDMRTPPTAKGFSLEHTPYQRSVAQVAGQDSRTIRTFVAPCTVSVTSLPFFKTKIWFVPAANYETNVLAFFRSPETRLFRWSKRFPRLQELIKDTQHTLRYLGDWNYRFLTQDRITMQGQDQRKVGKGLKDLSPTPSDAGMATFQDWLLTFANGGPFVAASNSEVAVQIGQRPVDSHSSFFSRELSFWESHGKFCPRCQRSMRRVSCIRNGAMRWSGRLLWASILVGGGAATATMLTSVNPLMMKALIVLTIQLLVVDLGLRRLVDWCSSKERRMYGVGADVWPPSQTVFGYQKVV